MKKGDVANCAQCNREIIIISGRHKYCIDCALLRAATQNNAARKQEWRERNPARYKAIEARHAEKRRRLLKLAKASIELMPSLKELL